MSELLFRYFGLALISLGAALWVLFGAYLFDFTPHYLDQVGFDALSYYFAATAGSALLSWGCILTMSAGNTLLQSPVAVGSAIGCIALALMRAGAASSTDPMFAPLAFLFPGEIFLFAIASLVFLEIGVGVSSRLRDVLRSFNAAPLWVQIWVWLFLVPTNLASFVLYFVYGDAFAGLAALGFTFIVFANLGVALFERGVSKLTSLPHLLPWIPLLVYASQILSQGADSFGPVNETYLWVYVVVIGISVAFDIYDTLRWLRGDRAVLTA